MVESPRTKKSPVMKIDHYMNGIETKKLVQVRSWGRVNYRLGTVLGKGGFAKVFQAEQYYVSRSGNDISRTVAVKIVPKARVTRQDQKSRVKSEMAIQSRINHRNILRMLTYWEDSEKYCMALEFCEQKTLLSYIKSFPNKMVPERETVAVMRQVLTAVQYLHDNDIIHRDIKLGNILRQRNVIKLGDFGLACNYKTDNVRQLCGTPNFLPPEVFKERLHSTGSDIWATGCVFYTMLAGENPFKYTSMEETKSRVCAMDYFIPHYFSYEATAAIKLFLCENASERPSASEAFHLEIFGKYERCQSSSYESDQVRRSLYFQNYEIEQPGVEQNMEQGALETDQNKNSVRNVDQVRRSLFSDSQPSTTGLKARNIDRNCSQARRSLFRDQKPTGTVLPASTPHVRDNIDQNQNLLEATSSNSPVYQLRTRRVDKSTTSKRRLFTDEQQNSPKRRAGFINSGKTKSTSDRVFITKWLDDYQNNGFGCKLSDGLTTVMLKDGTTVRGVHESNVEMVKGREAVNISFAREGQARANLKLWKQFDDYMTKRLLNGIDADINTSSDLRTGVLCFNRQSRAICFLLSNGVRQINFLSADERGLKFVIHNDGIIKVEARKQSEFSWNELCDIIDEHTVERLVYAKEQFDWLLGRYNQSGQHVSQLPEFDNFIKKFQ